MSDKRQRERGMVAREREREWKKRDKEKGRDAVRSMEENKEERRFSLSSLQGLLKSVIWQH